MIIIDAKFDSKLFFSSLSSLRCFPFFLPSFFPLFFCGYFSPFPSLCPVLYVYLQSCSGVFRSLNTIDKTVDECVVKIDTADSKLVFTFKCKHGIVKTYALNVSEADSLTAVYKRESIENSITIPTRYTHCSQLRVSHMPACKRHTHLTCTFTCVCVCTRACVRVCVRV